jgi:RNA polymerase sigma factor (TIGR02999 family)
MDPAATDITADLRAHASNDPSALGRLLPRVYGELKQIARGRLSHERPEHTLTPTDLVHEAFLKLLPAGQVDWKDRAHFFAIASRAMRNVLADHAERRSTLKRGGGGPGVTLDESGAAAPESPLDDLIAVSDALKKLEALDPRQARVVECRFFGGLSIDETATALDIAPATVSRDWTFARAWLHRELSVSG